MGGVCGCIQATAIFSEHNSWPQESRRKRVKSQPPEPETKNDGSRPVIEDQAIPEIGALTGACEVPMTLEVAKASSGDDNNTRVRVKKARRAGVEWPEKLRNNERVEEARRASARNARLLERQLHNEKYEKEAVKEPLQGYDGFFSREIMKYKSVEEKRWEAWVKLQNDKRVKRVEEARRARVEWLETLQRDCASQEEQDTARSQSVWTQLDSSACSSSCTPDLQSPEALERIREENRLHFQHLLDTERHSTMPPGDLPVRPFKEKLKELGLSWFYADFGDSLEAGQKFGGGAQADIHEAIYNGEVLEWCVLKVFKIDVLLKDLQCSWTKQLLYYKMRRELRRPGLWNCCGIKHGTLLQDGRFAFILQRCWGDLRKAIDLEIVKDKTHINPPFPHSVVVSILLSVASGMAELVRFGIVHKDLKAANCLLLHNPEDILPNIDSCLVADFECSEGVEGTRFWRAPEVLLALENKKKGIYSTKEVWTTQADVYSFAMTCYEVLTGCIPFEDLVANDYDGVIRGERPPLPSYVDPKLQDLVKRCWHSVPSLRPDFGYITSFLENMYAEL